MGQSIVLECPDLRNIEHHRFIYEISRIPLLDNVLGLLHGLQIVSIKFLFVNAPFLKPLTHAFLAFSLAVGVYALGDPAETPLREGLT